MRLNNPTPDRLYLVTDIKIAGVSVLDELRPRLRSVGFDIEDEGPLRVKPGQSLDIGDQLDANIEWVEE